MYAIVDSTTEKICVTSHSYNVISVLLEQFQRASYFGRYRITRL